MGGIRGIAECWRLWLGRWRQWLLRGRRNWVSRVGSRCSSRAGAEQGSHRLLVRRRAVGRLALAEQRGKQAEQEARRKRHGGENRWAGQSFNHWRRNHAVRAAKARAR